MIFLKNFQKLHLILIKEVKALKWKKNINWRPFEKTLEEFNSFY